eukprot:2922520-Pyramimonas_sp.AAC.1
MRLGALLRGSSHSNMFFTARVSRPTTPQGPVPEACWKCDVCACCGDWALIGGCSGDWALIGGCSGDWALIGGCSGDWALIGGCSGDWALEGGG